MRKTIFFASLVLAASVAFLTGCAKEIDAPEDTNIEDDATIDPNEETLPGIPFELIAGTTENTKTTMSEGNPVWVANDKMNVFYAPTSTSSYSGNCQFTITSKNLIEKKFTGDVEAGYDSEASYDWYALYPYNANITTPATTSGTNAWLALGSKNKGTNQVQAGNSNTDHLAGEYYPLYGKATGVAGATMPSLLMKQALAVVKVHVTNSSASDLTVTSVGFTATEPIVGTFYMNITGESPVFTKSGDTYVSNTASLTVESGSAITTGNTADFYIAVKPFTAPENSYITVTVNGNPKRIDLTKATVFSAGKIKKVNYNYKDCVDLPWESAAVGEGIGKTAMNAIDGVTAATDSDYASGPYYLKFNSSARYITIKTDSEIGAVSMAVKGYTASGTNKSELIVSGSTDGSVWTEVNRFEVPDDGETDVFTTTTDFTSTARYVKISFNRDLNNAGVGRIAITGPSTDPRIVADPIIVDALGGEDLLADYEAKNFVGSDDVSVKGYTGCVSAATIEGGKIKYTVNPNYSTSSDSGTITLQSAEASDKVVNVTQTGNTFSQSGASGSPLVLTITSDATTAEINLTSTVFGWNASVTPATEKNLTIKTGASTYVTSTTGTKSADAQTLTISSTEAAPTSGDPLVLGTLVLYRNGNSSDPQGISITVKKAVSGATLTDGAQYDYTFTTFPFDNAKTDTNTLGSLSWDYETDSEYHVYDSSSGFECLHFGSGGKTVSYVNFTLGYLSYCNSATAKLVKTVKVKARGNGTDPKLEVLVGGVSIEEKTITNSMDEYTFTVTGEKYGNIEIRMSYSSAVKKNLCIQQVKINK